MRIGGWLELTVFSGLLLLLVAATAAFGAADPFWKSLFTCLVFALGALAGVEYLISGRWSNRGLEVLIPIVVLIAFALAQTIPAPRSNGASLGISHRIWNAISSDPYETRVFALQLAGLALFAGLLFRYVTSVRRLNVLLHTIIGVALASALFALFRQTMQHQVGFLFLPYSADQGYGQFLNKNHFAFLMEMGLGLLLGLLASGGIRRQRLLLYLGISLPLWTALVLSGSRGGIMAMLAQLIATVLLFPQVVPPAAESSKADQLVRSRAARVFMIFTLVVMVAGGVFWVGSDKLVASLEASREEFSDTDETREGVKRAQVWRATMRMFEDNPIAGVGLGGYWAEIPRYHQASGVMTPQQAHNDYLEILSSGGFIGVAIVVWFGVLVWRKIRTNLAQPDRFLRAVCFAAVIAIIGVGVHSLVDFGLHRMANAMIFSALIVLATCNLTGSESRLKEDV